MNCAYEDRIIDFHVCTCVSWHSFMDLHLQQKPINSLIPLLFNEDIHTSMYVCISDFGQFKITTNLNYCTIIINDDR